MFCKNCGAEIADDAEFCGNCGAPAPRTNAAEKREADSRADDPVGKDKATQDAKEPGSKKSKPGKKRDQKPSSKGTNSGTGQKPPKKSHRKLIAILVILALGAAGIGGYLAYRRFANPEGGADSTQPSGSDQSNETKPTDAGGSYVSLDLGDIQTNVTDEKSALEAVSAVKSTFGLDDVDSQLTTKCTDKVGDESVYRFQQVSNGIPVYGRNVVVASDGDGQITAMNGNTLSISPKVTTPQVSVDDVKNAITKYVTDNYPDATDIEVGDFDSSDLVYYTFDRDEPCLAYATITSFACSDSAFSREVFVSAQDASVISSNDTLTYLGISEDDGASKVSINVKGATSTTSHNAIAAEASNGTLVTAYDPYSGTEKGPNNGAWMRSGDQFSEVFLDSTDTDLRQSAIYAVANLTTTIDFYSSTLNRQSFDDAGTGIAVFVGVKDRIKDGNGEDFGGNSAWEGVGNGNGFIIVSSTSLQRDAFPPSHYVADMGHEFTHGVDNDIRPFIKASEPAALDESLADILGICIHAKATNSGQIDWTCYDRDASSLSSTTAEEIRNSIADKNAKIDGKKAEEHGRSRIFSHAAYLIWKDWSTYGDPEDRKYTDALAKLFYLSDLMMPSDCTFSQAADCTIAAGEGMLADGELTQAQFDAIEKAFDEVGIYPFGKERGFTDNVNLFVKDINGYSFENYSVSFREGGDGSPIYLDSNGNRTTDATTVQNIPKFLKKSSFESGITYTMEITDSSNKSNWVTRSIIFLDDDSLISPSVKSTSASDTISDYYVYTNFGKSAVPPQNITNMAASPQDVVLVLDTSGSMQGDPLASLQDAVDNFADKVSGKDNISVGVVQYNASAGTLVPLGKNNSDAIKSAIHSDAFSSGGGTNLEEGIEAGEAMLESSGDTSARKTIILMTDGEPTLGNTDHDGLTKIASDIKNKGTNIYTLGFFNSLDDNVFNSALGPFSKAEAQSLLEDMSTQGQHYEATDYDIGIFFSDIANQINGQPYTFIKVACPVNITIEKDGEVLSSESPDYTSHTSFGSISYEDVDQDSSDTIKTVRLLQGESYDITLTGTGDGTMDYTYGLMDANGNYSDTRSFADIPITSSTKISTTADSSDATTLNLDSDGDGTYDMRYRANANGSGTEINATSNQNLRRGIVVGSLVVLFVLVTLVEYRRRKRRIERG